MKVQKVTAGLVIESSLTVDLLRGNCSQTLQKEKIDSRAVSVL